MAQDNNNRVVDEGRVLEQLSQFEVDSKSGVGIHMFVFTPRVGDPIHIGSEVTDTNSILNVVYQQWSKEYIRDTNGLKDVWKPIHKFNNGRALLAAVATLLRQGYEMKQIKP